MSKIENKSGEFNSRPGQVRSKAELERKVYKYHPMVLGPEDATGKITFVTTGEQPLEVLDLPKNGATSLPVSTHNGREIRPGHLYFASLGLEPHLNGNAKHLDWLEDPDLTDRSLMDKVMAAYPQYFITTRLESSHGLRIEGGAGWYFFDQFQDHFTDLGSLSEADLDQQEILMAADGSLDAVMLQPRKNAVTVYQTKLPGPPNVEVEYQNQLQPLSFTRTFRLHPDEVIHLNYEGVDRLTIVGGY